MSAAQRAEATNTTPPRPASVETLVTWRGTVFRLPAADQFPLEALEAEEEGRHLAALKLILGAEQYATWRTLATTTGDAEEFTAAVMAEVGRGNR